MNSLRVGISASREQIHFPFFFFFFGLSEQYQSGASLRACHSLQLGSVSIEPYLKMYAQLSGEFGRHVEKLGNICLVGKGSIMLGLCVAVALS